MHQALPARTTTADIFSLIKGATEAVADQGAVLRIVHDLAAAALEHNHAYVNYYQAGGRLSLTEWKTLWRELTDLAQQARQPGWTPTSDFEAHVRRLDGRLTVAEQDAAPVLARDAHIRHNTSRQVNAELLTTNG